ncbi:MAG: hypothetical protein DPW12_11925 [Rhodocyclaceae bacterium]|nr:hypothetical protein [Bacteroidia bacterium]MCQ3924879.1 hypothetical protein [Rhodocyclaceae bacterium]
MSHWVERIEGHQVFNDLDEFEKTLELAKESCQQDKTLVDHWDRAQAVTFHIRQALGQINPLLAIPGTLNSISTPLQQARTEISNFVANHNVAHWTTAQSHLDNGLVNLASIPRQTPDGIENMREAASSYRTSVAHLLDAIKRDGSGISKMQAGLQTKINEAAAEVANQKQRLDNAIATFQQQFSDAQQARQTEFATAEQARSAGALKNEEERQSVFKVAEERREEAETKAAEAAAKTHADLVTKLKTDAETILSIMGDQKKHAQKVVGIITDTGMAHGFQKTANEERDEASIWKRTAALSLIAWIIIGGVFFALTYDKDLTLAAVARQFLLSTPFVLLAGFAALQVSRHQKNERRMRQAELEIASIDPFLATLSDDDRNAVKREFATRYFGQKDVDHKQESTDPKLLDLAGSLVKIVQEFAKK